MIAFFFFLDNPGQHVRSNVSNVHGESLFRLFVKTQQQRRFCSLLLLLLRRG